MSNEEDGARPKRDNRIGSRPNDNSQCVPGEVKSKTKGGGRCCICFDPFSIQKVAIIVFFCCHAYHMNCLLDSTNNSVSGGNVEARATSHYDGYANGDVNGDDGYDSGDVNGDDDGTQRGTPQMRCILCTTATC